jgi:hypothetical protein
VPKVQSGNAANLSGKRTEITVDSDRVSRPELPFSLATELFPWPVLFI